MKTLLAFLLVSLSSFANTPNRPLTSQEGIAVARILNDTFLGHPNLPNVLKRETVLRAGFCEDSVCFMPTCNYVYISCQVDWYNYDACIQRCNRMMNGGPDALYWRKREETA